MLNTNSLSQSLYFPCVYLVFHFPPWVFRKFHLFLNMFLCNLSKITTFLAVRSMVFSLFFSIEPHFLDSSLSMRRVTSIHGHIKDYILHSRLELFSLFLSRFSYLLILCIVSGRHLFPSAFPAHFQISV